MTSSSSVMSKKQKIILACLIATLSIHLGTLFLFYTHPVFIYPYLGSILARAMPSKLITSDPDETADLERSEQLEDFFKEVVPIDQLPFDLATLPTKENGLPHQEMLQDLSLFEEDEIKEPPLEETLSKAPEFSFPDLPSAPLFSNEKSFPFLSSAVEMDKSSNVEFLDGLIQAQEPEELNEQEHLAKAENKKEEFVCSPEKALAMVKNPEIFSNIDSKGLPQLKVPDQEDFLAKQDKEISIPQKSSSGEKLLLPSLPAPFEFSERKPLLKGALSNAQYYGFPEEDAPVEWNDEFDVQVAFMPDEKTDKYIFSVSLLPNFDKSAEKMKQNFYFFIDRSNTVERHRYGVFKRATLKALASLHENSTFNIYILDRKIIKFSDKSLPLSKKNLHLAEEFLNKQEHHNIFSYSDLNTLEKILPSTSFPEDEVNTAILLTDGKALLKSHKQQRAISSWIKKNSGKATLYTAAAGPGNNLILLDLLSTLSGGALLYSDTHASFPRKMAKLMLDLQEPIAKEIVISAIPKAGKPDISFYPSSLPLSPLYNRRPFVIVGTIDELSDFTLVIQARNEEQLFTIKKEISFQGLKKGGKNLEKHWAVQQANLLYEDFLDDGKSAHLKEATKILSPHSSFVVQK